MVIVLSIRCKHCQSQNFTLLEVLVVVANFTLYICLPSPIKKKTTICIANSHTHTKMGFEGKFGGEFVDHPVPVMEHWV